MPPEIYREQQRGGNCRIHSLNAFYGRPEISDAQFAEYCRDYDKHYGAYALPKVKSWDCVLANQESIVSYILRVRSGLGTLYVAPGDLARFTREWNVRSLAELVDAASPVVFTFNENHIWVYRTSPIDPTGTWYAVDSMHSTRPVNMQSLPPKQGYMITLTHRGMLTIMSRIHQRVQKRVSAMWHSPGASMTRESFVAVVKAGLEARDGITAFEVDLCLFYRYLAIVRPNHAANATYSKFFDAFQRSPADHESIIQYAPALLHYICTVGH